jgi:hypothetical protein
VDGAGPFVGRVRQGQFAAFDPEPLEDDDEPVVDADDEEEEEEDGEDESAAGLLDVELSAVDLLDAVSLAVAALRLSVR